MHLDFDGFLRHSDRDHHGCGFRLEDRHIRHEVRAASIDVRRRHDVQLADFIFIESGLDHDAAQGALGSPVVGADDILPPVRRHDGALHQPFGIHLVPLQWPLACKARPDDNGTKVCIVVALDFDCCPVEACANQLGDLGWIHAVHYLG